MRTVLDDIRDQLDLGEHADLIERLLDADPSLHLAATVHRLIHHHRLARTKRPNGAYTVAADLHGVSSVSAERAWMRWSPYL